MSAENPAFVRFDSEPSAHGHRHQAEWSEDRQKLYLHKPRSVDTCGVVEFTEGAWWWWCLHDGCAAAGSEPRSVDAWSAFLGHEWCSHLSALVDAGRSVAQ